VSGPAKPPGEGALPAFINFDAFDQLATMVAGAADGRCLLANSALENILGLSRRTLQRGSVFDWLADPAPLRDTLQAGGRQPRGHQPLRRPAASAWAPAAPNCPCT
jgi:two-component system nitrogen regulation sensor histidine kinase GlnL